MIRLETGFDVRGLPLTELQEMLKAARISRDGSADSWDTNSAWYREWANRVDILEREFYRRFKVVDDAIRR